MSRGAEIALYAMMLILPLSSLLARRVPLAETAKMALAWITIFGIGIVLVGQRDGVAPIWDAARDTLIGRDRSIVGETVRIPMAADGHFWANVSIDGIDRRMLIDSGATTTAISLATATAAKVDVDASTFPTVIDTANGEVVARKATIARLRLGSISARDMPVVVSAAFGDTDVLGMNFLSRLDSWRVEGKYLVLVPRQHD